MDLRAVPSLRKIGRVDYKALNSGMEDDKAVESGEHDSATDTEGNEIASPTDRTVMAGVKNDRESMK